MENENVDNKVSVSRSVSSEMLDAALVSQTKIVMLQKRLLHLAQQSLELKELETEISRKQIEIMVELIDLTT